MSSSSQPFVSSPRPVLWRPTTALAGVNAAINLSWIIYRVHLAGLLTQAGFSATAAPLLLLIESVLAIAIEPWAGSTSDRTFQRIGGRFYIILIGSGFTVLLFLLLPGLVNLSRSNAPTHWWLPGLLIIWAVAISMVRSPALALLGNYATPKQLPLAASLVTLGGALAGSATPLASPWLLSLGATLTFIVAAVLLSGSIGWLKVAQPHAVPLPTTDRPPLRLSILLRIFGLGLAVTLAFRTAIELFPKVLKAAGMQPPLFMGMLFVGVAAGALLAGGLANRWGNIKVMILGLGLTATFLVLMTLTPQPILAFLTALAFGVAFGLVSNGTLPFALNFMPPHQAGLSVGLFFSGAAAANSLYSGFLGQPGILSPATSIGLGIVALLMAGFCLMGQASSIAQQNPSEN